MREMIKLIAVVIGVILIVFGLVGIESIPSHDAIGQPINQGDIGDYVAITMIGLIIFGLAAFKGWLDAEFLNHEH